MRPVVGLVGDAREDRHDDQPPIGELVVAHDGVAVVALVARTTEASKDVARLDRAIQHAPRGVEARALLRVDRHARVHELHDVIGPDGERIVGWIPPRVRALRAAEPDAESVEARDGDRRRAISGRRLLDVESARERGRDERRADGDRDEAESSKHGDVVPLSVPETIRIPPPLRGPPLRDGPQRGLVRHHSQAGSSK